MSFKSFGLQLFSYDAVIVVDSSSLWDDCGQPCWWGYLKTVCLARDCNFFSWPVNYGKPIRRQYLWNACYNVSGVGGPGGCSS